MKKIAVVLSALLISAAACVKEEIPEKTWNFTDKNPVAMEIAVQQDDNYKTWEFELDDNQLKETFGPTLPLDLLFYARDRDGSKHVGMEDFTSESGFYFTKSGNVCMPSAVDCAFFVDYKGLNAQKKPVISLGQYPGSCVAGDTATLEIGLADSVSGQPFQLKLTVREAKPWAVYVEHEDGLTYTLYQTVNADYKALEVHINETALVRNMGLASISSVISGVENQSILFRGVNADGSFFQEGSTANNYGHWFDAAGNVCRWQAENCSIYSEWAGTSPVIFNIGQFPSGVEIGDQFTIKQAFIYRSKTVTLTFHIEIVEET